MKNKFLSEMNLKKTIALILLILPVAMLHTTPEQEKALNQALVEAIKKDHLDIAEKMLNEGADANAILKFYPWWGVVQAPAIHYTAGYGSYKMMLLLLKHGADPLSKDIFGSTTLNKALNCGRKRLLGDCLLKAQYLLKNYPIDLNAQNKFQSMDSGGSALIYAVGRSVCNPARSNCDYKEREAQLKLIQKLLELGANPDLIKRPGDWPETALEIAVSYSDTQIIHLLVEGGADVNLKSPIRHTFRDCLQDQTFHYLLSRGAELKSSLLLEAAKNGCAARLKKLLKHNLNLNYQDEKGETALMFVPPGNQEIAQILIEAGADLNIQNKKGQSALIKATQNRQIETVKLLIKAKADLNFQDIYSYSALFYAISSKNSELVKLLIDAGANLNIKYKNGDTALSLARKRGDSRIIKLLESAGAR